MALGAMAKDRLEHELILSLGGGIYYDKARVPADENTATLFVGLGGTGADMLIRIKNEVTRRMKLPDDGNGKITGDTPNNIGFLAFDTDKSTVQKTWGVASFDPFGSEFCSLSVDNMPNVIASRKQLAESGDPVWKWYDKIDPIAGMDGAGGLRQIGRLMLFENVKKVYETIENKLKKIREGGITRAMVVLVTGIAGGTGSGTFLDMAYLLHKALNQLDFKKQWVLGYIVLPDVNLLRGGLPERLWANGFACLKELDYFMASGEGEQKDRFAQNYGSGIEVNDAENRAFHFCHLLSAQDMEGKPLSYDKVIGSMAENVFAYIAGEVGAQQSGNSSMSSMYDNINNYMDTLSASSPIPACYRYLALGSYKLEIPYEEISTLLAVRLFERLAPVFALTPSQEDFAKDMKYLKMDSDYLCNRSLTENVSPSPVDGANNYQYGQIWGNGNDHYFRNGVYSDVRDWIARNFQSKALVESAAQFANDRYGKFLDFVKANIKNEKKGPVYLTRLIKSDKSWNIISGLEKVSEHCNTVSAQCASHSAALEKEVQLAYNAGHGKIIMKQKAVDGYIAALRDWTVNECNTVVYEERAKVVLQLRDRLKLLHDKIFSRLVDVIEVLPGIFNQNLKYITNQQSQAAQEGTLDDTKLIWPLKFESENRREFEEMLRGACGNFLDSLMTNLTKWTGCDLETLDDNSGRSTDVPGFISAFIGEQFGNLLNINMEDIMTSKLSGAEGLDDYLHTQLLRLKERSIPMFSMRGAYRNTSVTDFAIVSVPEDCEDIKRAANNYLGNDKITVKVSSEKTRLYYVKVVSHLPLYAYTKIEEAEKKYEELMRNGATQKGSHLDGAWLDGFPSPLPEGAWTPDVYSNPRVKSYNAAIREAFDSCLEGGIVVPDNAEAPRKYFLHIADAKKADSLKTVLHGSLNDRLEQLREIRTELWGAETVELTAMGTYKNSDGKTLVDNIRESVLRLPKICEKLTEQAQILKKYDALSKEIEDPRYFANALICGLVVKQGFEIVLKRSLNSAIVEPLYDTTLDKAFEEYEAFVNFCGLLDANRRSEIEQLRTELLRRIGQGSAEKVETLNSITELIERYTAALPEVQTKLDRAQIDKRKGLQDTLNFYTFVREEMIKYKEKFLV
ncbi:MAG: tubulin-like doman-containing protein [Oscillospiraceae bacterium]|jgi:hypothetical protein|nr:tubulin-like doman-containing protein [Oscillospiraceae bacterium]